MSTLDATDMQEIRKLLDEMNHEYVADGDIRDRTMHNFMFLFPNVYDAFYTLIDTVEALQLDIHFYQNKDD